MKTITKDIGIGTLMTGAFHLLSSNYNWFEKFCEFSKVYEGWNLDDYMLTTGFALGIITFITERERNRRSQRVVKENENELRRIVYNIDDVIVSLSAKTMKNTKITPSIEKFLGYTPEEFLKSELEEKMTYESASKVHNFIQLAKTHSSKKDIESLSTELEYIRKNGSHVFGDITLNPYYDEKGNFKEMISVIRDATKRKEYERELINMSLTDSLTGIGNRKSFLNKLEESLKYAKRYEKTRALIYLDLDGFKSVNDNYGHILGDKLLIEVANRLKTGVRDTDGVYRLGGDEFSAILNNSETPNHMVVAEKLHSRLSEPYIIDGKFIDFVSASIGISLFPDHGKDLEQLVSFADTAMYKSKNENLGIYVYVPKK